MSNEHDICIRGAGIVGRSLALLLARQSLRVALHVPPDHAARAVDVRAYALSPAARQLLNGLRCWPNAEHATPVLGMWVQADRQATVRFDATELGVEALNWIVDVPALEQRLAEAVRYQPAIEVVNEPVPAPLTVVCEGRTSRTRAELGVEFETLPYPHHAVATRLDCARPHEQIARQWFTAEGDILAFLPLGGPQGQQVAVVWSQDSARAEAAMALDDAELAQRLEHISAGALGPLQVQGARARWPLLLAQAQRWVGPMPGQPGHSFALAGDAAHAMHPLAGQGLNVGLGDVAELARILAARESWRPLSDLRLLRRYERARQPDWQRMRLATDGLQCLFDHPSPVAGLLRNWGMSAFEHSGPLKARIARLAMGQTATKPWFVSA